MARQPTQDSRARKRRCRAWSLARRCCGKRRRERGPLGKPICVWEDGVFLGVKGSTGEIIVGDEKGVRATRT
eukprot:5559350-Lingulodinium_polyedra.AAC.1